MRQSNRPKSPVLLYGILEGYGSVSLWLGTLRAVDKILIPIPAHACYRHFWVAAGLKILDGKPVGQSVMYSARPRVSHAQADDIQQKPIAHVQRLCLLATRAGRLQGDVQAMPEGKAGTDPAEQQRHI